MRGRPSSLRRRRARRSTPRRTWPRRSACWRAPRANLQGRLPRGPRRGRAGARKGHRGARRGRAGARRRRRRPDTVPASRRPTPRAAHERTGLPAAVSSPAACRASSTVPAPAQRASELGVTGYARNLRRRAGRGARLRRAARPCARSANGCGRGPPSAQVAAVEIAEIDETKTRAVARGAFRTA